MSEVDLILIGVAALVFAAFVLASFGLREPVERRRCPVCGSLKTHRADVWDGGEAHYCHICGWRWIERMGGADAD